jgi:hypothetical protein
MKCLSRLTRLSAFAAATLLITIPARADKTVSVPFTLPMHINGVVDATGCQNSPGPRVTLGGEISLGGLTAKVTLSNNDKGTHSATVEQQFTVTLVPEGSTITIPKQPVLGGVGGNPHIYLQFHDGNGGDLSDEFYLGRCVQGLNVSADVLNAALLQATVETGGCSNHPGPWITLGGDITLGGLHARFIFRNNTKGTHTAEVTRDVTILAEGTTVTIPKQPSRGGVTGNPLITIQFCDENGDPISDPVPLGRCNQI